MFGILGATRVLGADGGPVALGGPRRRALLVLLLLDAGRMVSTERLIDGLYGEDPPAGVGNAVQSQVSRLRQVLPVPIEGHPAGYRLAVDPDDVDAHRFQRLAAEGRDALAAGDPDRAAGLLRDALALWRGPALADVGDAPFAATQTVRLEELRVGAVEDRIEADLALGRHRGLVAELGELVAERPLRERLRGQLMRALYGSGRQSEALAAYEDARRELADTLGADPGPELAAVHLAVLRGDPALLPGGDVPRETDTGGHVPRGTSAGPRAPQPLDGARTSQLSAAAGTPQSAADAQPSRPATGAGPPAGPRHDLPAPLTSFVGRSAELDRIGAQLERGRLVTLTGPGGAGKTRLAVEAAGRHPQDACFVELVGLTDGTELPQAVLGALGLRAGGLLAGGGHGAAAGAAPGPDPVARIAAALDGRALLLVLDNCEHLVADAARLAERLLAGSPLLRILATSREALGIDGEAVCPIATLGLPDPGADRAGALASPAVRLFAERAAAVCPDFDPGADLDSVRRLCAALDGLPLAIELAAARLRSLSVTEIAARLGALPEDGSPYSLGVRPDALFRLLSRGSRTAQPRQRTLRGVVDWSWHLLPADERAVLRRASVFAGGWTLAAAEAVCADGPGAVPSAADRPAGPIAPDDVLDLVAALVEKSLVVARHPDGAGQVRYRMLESIRAYGAERLAEAGETEAALRAHAGYFLDLALAADQRLRSHEQLEWLRQLTDERDNLQAALHRAAAAGDLTTAMRLIAALSMYWLLRGVRFDGAAAARQVLTTVGEQPPPGLEEEYALCVMAVVNTLPDPAEFAPQVAVTAGLMNGMNRLARRFPALTLLWAQFSGVPTEEVDTMAGLDEFLGDRDDPWYRALAHLGFAFMSWTVHGDTALAQREGELAIAGFRRSGDRWGMVTSLSVLADLADYRGESDRAAALLGEALGLAEELDSHLDMADLLCNRAGYNLRVADLAAVVADGERAVELARRSGAPETLAVARARLSEAARMRGDLPAARALCEQALAECPAGWFSSNNARAVVLTALSRVDVAQGRPAAARAHLREAVTTDIGAMRLPPAGAFAAEAAAGLALLDGAPRWSARLLGAARTLRGGVLSGPDAAEAGAAARAALGEGPYRAAFDGSAALDREAALVLLAAFVTEEPGAGADREGSGRG